MSDDSAKDGLEKSIGKASTIASDDSKLSSMVDDASQKATRNKQALTDIWDDLLSLLRLLKAWAKGEYRTVPWKTILMGAAAILYFLNPLDLVTDYLPGIGFLDDASVLAFVIKSIRNDLLKFNDWEGKNK